MYFRARPDLDYAVEIAIFCLVNDMEAPQTYQEKIIGVVRMVEIDDTYIDDLLNSHPYLYVSFINFLKGLC